MSTLSNWPIRVDALTTHNKMLEAQTTQQATSLSITLGKLPSKNELSPWGAM